jgi:Apea-like HEPN
VTRPDPEELFLRFAEMVSGELEIRKPVLPELDEVVKFTDSGWGGVIEPNYGNRLLDATEEIGKREETETCARRHLEAGLIDATEAGNVVRHLLKPVVDAANEAGSARPAKELLLNAYRTHRKLWASDERSCEVTATLTDFDSDLDETQLTEEVRLRPLPADEKARRFRFSPSMMLVLGEAGNDIVAARYALMGTFRVKRASPVPPAAFNDAGRDLITSLRLLHGGVVGVGPVLCAWKPALFNDATQLSGSRGRGLRHGNRYRLDRSELPALLALKEEIAVARAAGRLRGLEVALRRFDLSYERERPEDRLIDLTIALESSLLADLDQELRYRIAVRGAALLSPARTSRETFRLLRAMYDVRSAIVHGGSDQSDASVQEIIRSLSPAVPPERFTDEAEEVVRLVLRRYVELLAGGSESVKRINENLEQRILGSLQ